MNKKKFLIENIVQALKNDPDFTRKVLPYVKGGTDPSDIANRISKAFASGEIKDAIEQELASNPELIKALQRSTALRASTVGQGRKESVPSLPPQQQTPTTRPSIPQTRAPEEQQPQKQPPPLPKQQQQVGNYTSLDGARNLGSVELLAQGNENFPEQMLLGVLNKNPEQNKLFKQKIADAFSGKIEVKFNTLLSAVAQLADKGLIDQSYFNQLKQTAKQRKLIEEENRSFVRLGNLIF